MKYMIRELRDISGMTQKAFASAYEIPLSTLRKWEQGASAPAPYVINLIARTLPGVNESMIKIEGNKGTVYYFEKNKKLILDSLGNAILVKEDLEEIRRDNLIIYLQDLFEGFYDIQEKFNQDCRYDKEDDILWTR